MTVACIEAFLGSSGAKNYRAINGSPTETLATQATVIVVTESPVPLFILIAGVYWKRTKHK